MIKQLFLRWFKGWNVIEYTDFTTKMINDLGSVKI